MQKQTPEEKEKCTIFYDLGIYEITLNPSDKYQYFGKPKRVALCVQNMINTCHKTLNECGVTYRLYPEISEPHINVNNERQNSMPRFHYHGHINFTQPFQVAYFLAHTLYTLSRTCNVTVNEYRQHHWPHYISKQAHIMRPLMEIDDLPYHIDEKTRKIIFQDPTKFKLVY